MHDKRGMPSSPSPSARASRTARTTACAKRPFAFNVALPRIRRTLAQLGVADAAMFELASRGHRSVFEQIVACIISIRTRDEVMVELATRLFEAAPTPQDVASLSLQKLDRLIGGSTFHAAKARQIREIARVTVSEFGGTLPCEADALLSLRGVGPKCANLALGISCGHSRIGVDVHVHRVTNRWGVISTSRPEQTMEALEQILPRRYWVEINRLLVPFGKHVCTGHLPKCSTCPVLEMCRQVGVTAHR
jgi:endonuclease-3